MAYRHKPALLASGQPDQRKREKIIKEIYHSNASPQCVMGMHQDFMPKAHACRRNAMNCGCNCHKGKLF